MQERTLRKAMDAGAEYCDIRVERKHGLSLELKDGELREAIPGDESGMCIRVLFKGSWGHCSVNDLSAKATEKAILTAIALAKARAGRIKPSEKVKLASAKPEKKSIIRKVGRNPHDVPLGEKHRLLQDINGALKDIPEVRSVTAVYGDGTKCMHFISSEGADIYTEVTRVVASGRVVVKNENGALGGRAAVGGTSGYGIFTTEDPVAKAVAAARSAIVTLSGRKAPSGRFPVVADPVLTGVFAHEAVGHAVEGDIVASGDSCLQDMFGKMVGSPLVTLVDDPTLAGAFGSFPYDDEGVLARRKVLIDKGRMSGYITDRESAFRLGTEPNGAARAESYSVRPIVRMSNTFIEKGDASRDELFEGIKLGIYALGSSGGQVDTAKGSFQFSCKEAFLIENGQVTSPLRNLALSGIILETLKKVALVGKDIIVREPGYCGKGQTVAVGDGGPHIRISSVAVGGG
jgi:TldD protein